MEKRGHNRGCTMGQTRSDTYHHNPDIKGCSGREQLRESRIEERGGVCGSPIESGGGAEASRVFRDGSRGELSRRAQCFVANPFWASC
jgi:hypothetical protein